MKKKCSGFISAQAGRPFFLAIFIMVTLGLALALTFAGSLFISSTSAYPLTPSSSSSVIPSAAADPDSAPAPSSPYSPEEFVRRRLALMELVASSNLSTTANLAEGGSGSTATSTTTPTTPVPAASASGTTSTALTTAARGSTQGSTSTTGTVSAATPATAAPGSTAGPTTVAVPAPAPTPTPAANSLIILFAAPSHTNPAGHFRQNNDFYYFTGCEDPDAILVMMPASRDALLFVPEKSAGEKSFEGPNSLDDPTAKDRFKVRAIMPLSNFDEFLARLASRPHPTFYLRLSPADTVSEARYEAALFQARRARNPYNAQLSLDQFHADRLHHLYPSAHFEDVTPLIDSLRMIKSSEEIAVLRRNGQISAEAVKRAMLATRPAAYEYELEAAVMEVILRHGCRGPAYTPIIGSGPNTCIMHYDRNDRRMQAGELVLMDFGGDLNYLTMDITRTWPVSGKFTAEQKKIYRTVLEVEKACIEAFKPGVTSRDVEDYVARRMKEKGIDAMGLRGGLGHLVGMSVHDVQTSPGPLVLKEGMVMAIEPALYFPDKNLGIRIEDTVLITKDGCEVLTADVPKEIEEIEALFSKR